MGKGMSPETAESIRIKRGLGRGSNLRKLRVKNGLSQSDLAVKSGVPLKSLQYFEQFPDKIDGAKLNTLCDICLALNCGIGDIIEGEQLKAKYHAVK